MKRIFIKLFCVIALLIVGCSMRNSSVSDSSMMPVVEDIKGFESLDNRNNLQKAILIKHLNLPDKTSINAMQVEPRKSELFVIQESGVLTQIGLQDFEVKQSFYLTSSRYGLVSFSEDAKYVFIAKSDEPTSSLNVKNKNIIYMWDASEAKLLQTFVFTAYQGNWVSLSVSGNGSFVTAIEPWAKDGINSIDLSPKSVSFGASDYYKKDYGMGVVTLDRTGKYEAIFRKNGIIIYGDPSGISRTWLEPIKSDYVEPRDIKFDPTGRYLAYAWDGYIGVTKLDSESSSSKQIGENLSYIDLNFDDTGKWLLVGTIRGWQVWDVNLDYLIRNELGVSTTSIVFSPDKRLVITGDPHGGIRFWGIK